jgi:plastocyanin
VNRRIRLIVALTATLAVVGVAAGLAVAGPGAVPPNTIAAQGHNAFTANVSIQSSFRYNPGSISIQSGTTLTVQNVSQIEGHTFSIVKKTDLPQTFDQAVQGCFSPNYVCSRILASHFPPGQPPVIFVDKNGDGGLDVRGDSYILKTHGSFSVAITASPGTDLYFMCAFHPWMQGVIHVT